MSIAEANGTQAAEPQSSQATEGQAPPPGKPRRARPRASGARDTRPAIESHYQFIVWLIPTLNRFPRAQRFLLGDRIRRTALDVLESLIEAT